MALQFIQQKTTGFFWALFILLLLDSDHAEAAKIHSQIEGNRLQIVLDWPDKVSPKATVDDSLIPILKDRRKQNQSALGAKGRELLLQFDRSLGILDFEQLTAKTSGWLDSIQSGYDTLLLESSAPVSFKVFAEGKKVRIEIIRQQPPSRKKASEDNDLLVTFAESVLAKNRPELIRPILKKYGEEFLSPHPLLAAQLMLALKDNAAALSWTQKADSQPGLTLDQQITLVGLYVKLGQTEMISRRVDIPKLVNLIARDLQAPGLSESRMEELVFALVELKAHEQALPHLKQLAYKLGGDWISPYEETLVILEKKQELIDFWRLRAKQPDLSDEENRQLAFQFLDAYSKADAEEIFKALAETAAPNSPDVKQLLFLWGPRPASNNRMWLLERARASAGEQRAEWTKHLVNAGGAQEAIRLAEGKPMKDNMFAVYLEALEELDDETVIASAITQRLKTEDNPGRLLHYGTLAEDHSQLKLAEAAYTKLINVRPDDKWAIRKLGRLSFDQSRWEESRGYFERLLNKTNEDWAINFYYAESIFLLGKTFKARLFFRRALKLLKKTPSPTSSMQMAQAHCLHRLGQNKEARVIYEDLQKIYPNDKRVRVKYISLLMDIGDFEQAEKWLTLIAK